jgi:hypothetical protein
MSKLQSESFISIFSLRNILLLFLGSLLTVLVLSQANPGITLPGRDYGIFSYIGQQITLGKLPYKDAWDQKPPAIFYLDAFGLWLAHGYRWGIWGMEFIAILLSIWFSYYLLKKNWGVLPALLGTAVWIYGLYITLEGGNRTEEFPLPLHFLAVLIFLALINDPQNYFYGFGLGLTFSLSFLFRANNAMVETAAIASLFLIWLFQRQFRTIRLQIIFIGLGVLLPILTTGLYFWSRSIFKEMFDGSITYNLIYSGTRLSNEPVLLAAVRNLGLLAWIGLLGYLVVIFYLLRQWRAGEQVSALVLFLLIGCPIAATVTDPAQRTYPHYFINWLPYIALLTGLVVYSILKLLQLDHATQVVPELVYLGGALIVALSVFVVSGLAVKNKEAFVNLIRRSPVERNSVVSVYARENTRRDEQVLFWGGFPGENFMAHRSSPSAYITYPLLLDSNLSKEYSDQFLRDLTGHPPVLIVDMEYANALYLDPQKRAEQLASLDQWPDLWPFFSSNIEVVFKFINDNYHVDHVFRNAVVYRLNGTSSPY